MFKQNVKVGFGIATGFALFQLALVAVAIAGGMMIGSKIDNDSTD